MYTATIIDGKTDNKFNILINRNRYLNLTVQCEVYSGETFQRYFDFSLYTGATLQVKTNKGDKISPLTFTTTDSSIQFLTDGMFKLYKTADQLKLRAGNYEYDMILNSASVKKYAFITGTITINETVSD